MKNNKTIVRTPGTCPNCNLVAVKHLQVNERISYNNDTMVVLASGKLSPHVTPGTNILCFGSLKTRHSRS